MITSLEAYEKYLIKVNRNDSNSNIYVPRGKFVVIYNEQARKWTKEKETSNEWDELSDLLETDFKLKRLGTNSNNIDFELPTDFFNFNSSYSIASRRKCERRIDNWEVKGFNLPIALTDENNRPSFDWEETFFLISKEKIKVYFDGFKIKDAFFSYYRFPKKIDVEGYIGLDGKTSTNIDPDLNDLAVDEIISRAAIETIRNSENPDAFPFAKDRINTEEKQ